MTRRASIKAGPLEEAEPEETSGAPDEEPLITGGDADDLDGVTEAGEQSAGAESGASGAPGEVAAEQPPAGGEPDEPEEPEEDVEQEEPAAVAEEKEPAADTEPEAPEPAAEMAIPESSLAAAPGVPVLASSMDSLTLPERSRHEADIRRQRRRRSAALLPALVTPVDIPEDAAGRIEFMVVRAGVDRDEPALGETPLPRKPEDRVRCLLTLGSGWVAVAVLAAVLAAVFVVLSFLYRW